MNALANLRRDALAIYHAALRAVAPEVVTRAALARIEPGAGVWLVGLGKAAPAMTGAGLERLRDLGIEPLGGLVVTTADQVDRVQRLPATAGDHPVPGPASLAAADGLEALLTRVGERDEVWVFLSGGTSSLVAAPVDGLPASDYRRLQDLLARAGLPIDELNAVRKRFSRWGAGRLVSRLPARAIRVFALSDVPGPIADIGSGPCEPDRWSAAELRRLLDARRLWSRLPEGARAYLEQVIAGARPETPKPNDPSFARRSTILVADNATAVRAAGAAARELGYRLVEDDTPLAGEAAKAGRRFAERLAALPGGPPAALIRGGETTVALGDDAGLGGRSQELALAAARLVRELGRDAAVLAAGTDGRDGPTDAAGALVGPETWDRIRAAGVDPDRALRRHDAHPALDAANALLRTGPTGTNVMDLAIGLVS
ncbi:MAG: glycerate kinase [Gemmatimonadales bacterium]